IAAGAFAIALSLRQLSMASLGLGWFILAGVTIVSGSAILRMPAVPVTFSISDTFTITAALMFGPAAGTVAVALDGLAMTSSLARRQTPVRRVLFNATAPAPAMWIASHVFFWLAGTGPLAAHPGAIAGVNRPP